MDSHNLIAIKNRLIYEGNSVWMHLVNPVPIVLEAECSSFNINGVAQKSLIFREDSFDALAQIRRGRFYRAYNPKSAWNPDNVCEEPYRITKNVQRWMPDNCYEAAKLLINTSGQDYLKTSLGFGLHSTEWNIICIEGMLNGHQLFTIKRK
jgi:hypothetical protein